MLDQFSRAILDFERGWWRLPGPKDELVGVELGCSAADYYRHLLALLEDPEAREYDPLTVLRLQRLCESANPSVGAVGARSR
jgi:hypothetical protein